MEREDIKQDIKAYIGNSFEKNSIDTLVDTLNTSQDEIRFIKMDLPSMLVYAHKNVIITDPNYIDTVDNIDEIYSGVIIASSLEIGDDKKRNVKEFLAPIKERYQSDTIGVFTWFNKDGKLYLRCGEPKSWSKII